MSNLYQFSKKTIFFLKKYSFSDPVFILYCLWSYFQQVYRTGVLFYSKEEIRIFLLKGKSFLRLGDGEIRLIHGDPIYYQRYEKDLDVRLKKIIKDYTSKSSYILAIPIFAGYSNRELAKVKDRLQCWLPLKIEFNRRFNKNTKYGDAHIFYYKNWFQQNIAEYLKTKKIIINTTQENIDLQKKAIEREFNVVRWIPAQSPNPFDLYEQTKNEIRKILDEYEGDKSKLVFLMSSGPMGKLLVRDFCDEVQCIDIGAGFEQLYNNVNFENRIKDVL